MQRDVAVGLRDGRRGVPRRVSPCGYLRRDAAAEPRHASRRARRRSRERPRLRKPRLPARRGGPHPAPVPGAALDRLPPRVQGTAPNAAPAAREVHGALLPRRGDRIRRGSPSVRGMPARGLRPLHDAVARSPRRDGRGRDRREAPRRARRAGDAGAPSPRDDASQSFPTARSSSTTVPRSSCWATSCSRGRPAATSPASPARRGLRR